MDLKMTGVWCGLLGLLLPASIVLVDRFSGAGWWPRWTIYVWPTSYMLVSNSAIMDATAYAIIAFSILLNMLIYALIGIAIYGVVRAVRS